MPYVHQQFLYRKYVKEEIEMGIEINHGGGASEIIQTEQKLLLQGMKRGSLKIMWNVVNEKRLQNKLIAHALRLYRIAAEQIVSIQRVQEKN